MLTATGLMLLIASGETWWLPSYATLLLIATQAASRTRDLDRQGLRAVLNYE